MTDVIVQDPVSWRKALAEGIGTLALLYVGILVLTVGGGDKHLVEVALAHGLTIAVMASATMSISGGQLNPAVTIGLLAIRKITPGQAGVNVLAQIVGGLLGGVLASVSVGTGVSLVPGVPDLAPGVGNGTGILVEAILTFFLMFVIMGTAVDPRMGGRIAGLAIGLTVTLDILAAGPITGAAMNPARWFGAALPAAHYANALVYVVGPILGAVVAALVYNQFLMEPRPRPEPAAVLRPRDNL